MLGIFSILRTIKDWVYLKVVLQFLCISFYLSQYPFHSSTSILHYVQKRRRGEDREKMFFKFVSISLIVSWLHTSSNIMHGIFMRRKIKEEKYRRKIMKLTLHPITQKTFIFKKITIYFKQQYYSIFFRKNRILFFLFKNNNNIFIRFIFKTIIMSSKVFQNF